MKTVKHKTKGLVLIKITPKTPKIKINTKERAIPNQVICFLSNSSNIYLWLQGNHRRYTNSLEIKSEYLRKCPGHAAQHCNIRDRLCHTYTNIHAWHGQRGRCIKIKMVCYARYAHQSPFVSVCAWITNMWVKRWIPNRLHNLIWIICHSARYPIGLCSLLMWFTGFTKLTVAILLAQQCACIWPQRCNVFMHPLLFLFVCFKSISELAELLDNPERRRHDFANRNVRWVGRNLAYAYG